jgi:hypothetical protein
MCYYQYHEFPIRGLMFSFAKYNPLWLRRLSWVCFISVETVPKVAAKAAKFLGKTFGTFLLSTRLKHTLCHGLDASLHACAWSRDPDEIPLC